MFEAWRNGKEHQGPNTEAIEAQDQSCKNRSMKFWKLDVSIFF
jgi:hypothetical protein